MVARSLLVGVLAAACALPAWCQRTVAADVLVGRPEWSQRAFADCALPGTLCHAALQPCCGNGTCATLATGESACDPSAAQRARAASTLARRVAARGDRCDALLGGGAGAALGFAVPAHVSDRLGLKVLLTALRTIRVHHPAAPVVVVDNASPRAARVRDAVVADAARRRDGAVDVVRANRSGWELGALVASLEHWRGRVPRRVVLMQHTLGLARPLPADPPCAVTSLRPMLRGGAPCGRCQVRDECAGAGEARVTVVDAAGARSVRRTCGWGYQHNALSASRGGLARVCRAGEFDVAVDSKQRSKDSEASLGLVAGLVGAPAPWCEELQSRADGAPGREYDSGVAEKLVHGSEACARLPWSGGMPYRGPMLANGRIPEALYARAEPADCEALDADGPGVDVAAVLAALPAWPP